MSQAFFLRFVAFWLDYPSFTSPNLVALHEKKSKECIIDTGMNIVVRIKSFQCGSICFRYAPKIECFGFAQCGGNRYF